jgi:protein transport protein SEC31
MEDGSFKFWNPHEMIASYPNREAPSLENIDQEGIIIYEEEIDSSFPIMCGEWNGLNNNILALGSTDVYIVIIDKDPSDPDLRKPGSRNPHQGSYVTSVSWNREVPQILASASENGLVALWDTKANKSIFQFRDSGASTSGNRNVAICWSKSISTQIAVTLDDEKHN